MKWVSRIRAASAASIPFCYLSPDEYARKLDAAQAKMTTTALMASILTWQAQNRA